jgi:hypothetical protein
VYSVGSNASKMLGGCGGGGRGGGGGIHKTKRQNKVRVKTVIFLEKGRCVPDFGILDGIVDEGHIISMADGNPILGEDDQTISANNVFEVRIRDRVGCGIDKWAPSFPLFPAYPALGNLINEPKNLCAHSAWAQSVAKTK